MRVEQGTIRRKTTIEGQQISFITKDVREADKIFSKWFDKPLQVEIKPQREKRSLNANSYMWVLCDQIADVILSTKEKVYRESVKEVGVFSDVAIQSSALATFLANWESRGIGWFAEVFNSKLKGCNRVRCYYGSSGYDSKQMARLIDYVVEQANELDIETATPDELKRMKQMWQPEI